MKQEIQGGNNIQMDFYPSQINGLRKNGVLKQIRSQSQVWIKHVMVWLSQSQKEHGQQDKVYVHEKHACPNTQDYLP